MNVRRQLTTTIVLLLGSLLGAGLAGCSDDTSPDGDEAAGASGAAATDSGATDAAASTAGDAGATTGGTGDVDCEAIDGAIDTVGLGVQVLAQLQTQDQYDLITGGTLAFDPDGFDAALAALEPLAAIDTPLGSVSESLALYSEASALARENLAVTDPFAEAKGNELVELVESPEAFIGHQASISYALDEAGC